MVFRWMLVLLFVGFLSLVLTMLQPPLEPANEIDHHNPEPWPAPGENLILPLSGTDVTAAKEKSTDTQIPPAPSEKASSIPKASSTPTSEPANRGQLNRRDYMYYLEPQVPFKTSPVLPTPLPTDTPAPSGLPQAALVLILKSSSSCQICTLCPLMIYGW
jgi:hypothetical protein